jgi:hypothetical protein
VFDRVSNVRQNLFDAPSNSLIILGFCVQRNRRHNRELCAICSLNSKHPHLADIKLFNIRGMLLLNYGLSRTRCRLGSNRKRSNMTVNVWDQSTWELLTEARQRCRDEIFDAGSEQQKKRAEAELKSVEHEIAEGNTRVVPF